MHPRQARLIKSAVGFFAFFIFIPPFAFFGDLPSRVRGDKEEGFFATAGQWISAAFHVLLSIFVLVTFGVWGFASLALTVVIVARRLSARKGIPYALRDLRDDLSLALAVPRLRNIVVYGTGATLLLQLTTAFGLPTNFFAAVASVVIWGTWIFLAAKASKMNVGAAHAEHMTRAERLEVLTHAFPSSAADWDNSEITDEITDEGAKLIVTRPPKRAVLNYGQADSLLAQIAPEWEMDHEESNHERLVLQEASEETIRRRKEESQSGGLIAGKISETHSPSATPVFAGVSISADDLF